MGEVEKRLLLTVSLKEVARSVVIYVTPYTIDADHWLKTGVSLIMDSSNKDEAIMCFFKAKEAIAAGDKQRALKFIGMARRLDHMLSVDNLLAACKNLKSTSSPSSSRNENMKSYTEEHVQLITMIKRCKGYYEILGVEKNCSAEEIKKAYKKLSLKVHPDKNKAPGSEEAFKMVGKAFMCLSSEASRRQYDRTCWYNEYQNNQQYNNVRTRGRTGEDDWSRKTNDYQQQWKEKTASNQQQQQQKENENEAEVGPNVVKLIQFLPILFIILLAFLPLDPDYSVRKNYSHQFAVKTAKHGFEFFVQSQEFEQKFPPGSSARADIENEVIKNYQDKVRKECRFDLESRNWVINEFPPSCKKLESFGLEE